MNLEDKLISMEGGDSFFELKLRDLKLPVSPVFKSGGKLSPCLFKEDKELKSKNDGRRFPKSIKAHGNKVLKGIKGEEIETEKKKVAVLFSGGPAPGGHNVLCGLYDLLKNKHELIGVRGGPGGLLRGDFFPIDQSSILNIKNSGGFDFLGTDRTKLKSAEQFEAVLSHCKKEGVNAVVVIGGDDSNTNSAFLAEKLFDEGIQVIGAPKTIDGDMQLPPYLPITFGFDSATKVYAEMVGNILKDSQSSLKYWHFVKLMGRSASHVTLEVALQTKPAMALITEEIRARNITLYELIEQMVGLIVKRAEEGAHHGVVLAPEGLFEAFDDVKRLVDLLTQEFFKAKIREGEAVEKDFNFFSDAQARKRFEEEHEELLSRLPDGFLDFVGQTDSHGNIELSKIPTETLLIELLENRLKQEKIPFNALGHFFGYEGRCGAPSMFDLIYSYHLGLGAASLVLSGKTGLMVGMGNLSGDFEPYGIPISALLTSEMRHGKEELVIEKSLVDLKSPAFLYFEKRRKLWAKERLHNSPGPIQYSEGCYEVPISVALNEGYKDFIFETKSA